jgi:hypothetical protein
MHNVGKISLHGNACPIHELQLLNPKYFLHKLSGPGLKYEIGICILTGWIVWYNRPFLTGKQDVNMVGLVFASIWKKKEIEIGRWGEL